MRVAIGALSLFSCAAPAGDAPFVETARIELPKVEGRIDHLSFDPAGQRLFIAALGNGSVEVIDLAAGRATQRIDHLEEPQGIAWLAASGELAFTTGGDGNLHVYDGKTLVEKKVIAVGDDADNVRVDAAAGLLYVGAGEGLAIVDVKKWEKVASVALAGHAESFQLDAAAGRIYVNVPDARHVAVVDLKERKVVAKWELGDAAANFPMALDAAAHRLYVGCRTPACLVVIDTTSGQRVGKLALGGDCDDVFLDGDQRRLCVTCGSGVVSSFAIDAEIAGKLTPLTDFPTAAGARTGLFVAVQKKLYVAVPHRGDQRAEVRTLDVR